jgi:hypothetical protein
MVFDSGTERDPRDSGEHGSKVVIVPIFSYILVKD